METNIQCPQCGKSIAVAEAVAYQAEVELRAKIEIETRQNMQAQQKAFEQATYIRLAQEQAAQMTTLQQTIQQQAGQLKALTDQQNMLVQKEAAIAEREKTVEVEARKLAEVARKQILEQAQKQVEDIHRLKDLEKDKSISDMRAQIDQLQQRANQGSQQAQGDAGEVDLERMLKKAFPGDIIERVKNTGDIIHMVKSDKGHDCGIILWESKNTQAWNNKWLDKALSDQRERGAVMAAIVSETMPKDVEQIGQKSGVWVISRDAMPDTAILLRTMVLELARVKFIQGVNTVKFTRLRQYMLGDRFTGAVQRIVKSQQSIKDAVTSQRQAMTRTWTTLEDNSTLATNLINEISATVDDIMKDTQPAVRPSVPRTPGYAGDMPMAA